MEALLAAIIGLAGKSELALCAAIAMIAFYAGMKVTMIRAASARDELLRLQDEIEYLAEENRKLRNDVREAYRKEMQQIEEAAGE